MNFFLKKIIYLSCVLFVTFTVNSIHAATTFIDPGYSVSSFFDLNTEFPGAEF